MEAAEIVYTRVSRRKLVAASPTIVGQYQDICLRIVAVWARNALPNPIQPAQPSLMRRLISKTKGDRADCFNHMPESQISNLVLDDLDKELTRRGHRFCRYADDCNIYVRSRRAGERVMASVSRFLTRKLRLTVNEAKSAVAQPEERKFLGFSISNDGSERRIAPKALDKFKTQVRDLTRPHGGSACRS